MVTKNNQVIFKESEIGLLPKEWEVRTIDDVCEILDSKRIPLNKEQRDSMRGNIPYYGANGVVDFVNDYLFDEPLILMAEDGGYFDEYQTRPIAYKVEGKCWVNNHAHILRPKNMNSLDWIFYNLVHKNILNFISGGTRAKLNQGQLKKIPIAYPPIDEQQKLADILKSFDNTISKTEDIIEQTEKVKKGLMQQLLTKGIGHTKFKQTEIGEIPEEWSIGTLKDYSDHITKGATPTTYGFDWVEEGILFLRNECIKESGISFEGSTFISDDAHNTMKRSVIRHGDILITITGNLGRSCIFDKGPSEANINQHIARIRINNEILNSKFVSYFLNSNFMKKQYDLIRTGLAYPQLSLKQIQEIRIPIPSSDEQYKIVSILESINEKRKIEDTKLLQLQSLKKGLMQVLLTGKVRVKVDNQEVITK